MATRPISNLTYVTLYFLDVSMSFIFRSDVDWIINQLLVIIPVLFVVFLHCINIYTMAQKLKSNAFFTRNLKKANIIRCLKNYLYHYLKCTAFLNDNGSNTR